MKREEKDVIIGEIAELLNQYPNVYVTDTSALTVEKTNQLRRLCFSKGVKMLVAKNTLIQKAMERHEGGSYTDLFASLKGTSALMFCETGNVPAKLIKEFRKKGSEKPLLKGAYIDTAVFLGDNQLDMLSAIKSKNELIADIVALLQSPARNVVSALQSSGGKLAGIVKTLSERAA
ncbi:MAG: 50S ribosomal protein L10 [Bacteroidota bacterium]